MAGRPLGGEEAAALASGYAMSETPLPEKARLLQRLRQGGFDVPPFLHLDAATLANGDLEELERFLEEFCQDYKVIVRSCHPLEERYKGGTFESVTTYSDVGGVRYAWKRIQKGPQTNGRLSILRQQKFQHAPELNVNDTGVIVMPFIEGGRVMAKQLGSHWEFGYCRDRLHRLQSEPYITQTPHDRRLLELSQRIQDFLGFRCEIEYVVGVDGRVHVVQAHDISRIETLELKESKRRVELDRLHRIRRRRNYRERAIYVMDNQSLYLDIIGLCEDLVHGPGADPDGLAEVLELVRSFERRLERFALSHERFGVLGLSIEVPEDLFQVASHYLDDTPELQAQLSAALHQNLYKVDQFLAEADTLIAQDRFRRNLCSHDAYGINTVRNPLWSCCWGTDRHQEVVARFKALGFTTGDYVGIEVDEQERPTVFRL
jgi:hypothetical protein